MSNEFCQEDRGFENTEFNLEEILDEILLDESIVSTELNRLSKTCEIIKEKLDTIQLPDNQQKGIEKYIAIVADCQKRTAEFANAAIETYALHPAIETVFALTNIIEDLFKQSVDLTDKQNLCQFVKPMLNSVSEAVKIANDKCQYLGIEKISINELEDLNSHEHEIKQTVATNNNDKHKKIHQMLIPGLKYRGKVLIPAKVSVYCFKN